MELQFTSPGTVVVFSRRIFGVDGLIKFILDPAIVGTVSAGYALVVLPIRNIELNISTILLFKKQNRMVAESYLF